MTYEANECHCNDERVVVLRRSPNNKSNKHECVASNDKPASTEKIRICTADPEIILVGVFGFGVGDTNMNASVTVIV